MASLQWGLSTHEGNVRPQNEDNAFADGRLFVVADGMGGHLAGEVASEMVVTRLHESFAGTIERPQKASPIKKNRDKAQSADRSWSLPGRDALVAAVYEANGEIYDESASNPDRSGMGTTVAVITVVEDVIEDEAFAVANVGDSRIYRLRHGRLRQISIDHSFVQELVAEGAITRDEARIHPRRNIITRALGIDSHVRVDSWTLPIVRGDRYLLCSDGLVDEVTDDDIASILIENADPQDAADRCVESALANGGRDNVTVLVLDVLEGLDPPAPTEEIEVIPTWDDDLDEIPTGEVAITPGIAVLGGEIGAIPAPADVGSQPTPKPAPTPTPKPATKKKKKKRPPTAAGATAPTSDINRASGSKPGTTKTAKAKSVTREPGSSAGSTSTTSTSTSATSTSKTRRVAADGSRKPPKKSSKPPSASSSSETGGGASPSKIGSASTSDPAADNHDPDAAGVTGTPPDVTPRSMPRTRSRVAEPPTVPTPARRRGGASRLVLSIGVAAVVVLGAVIVTAWARSSYFITFNSEGVAALYKGKDFLWFHPTEEWPYAESRAELTPEAVILVDGKPTFKSPASADSWAEHNLVTTTTTTSTTTTTTVAPVVAPVSTSVPPVVPVAPVPATPPVPPASTIGP